MMPHIESILKSLKRTASDLRVLPPHEGIESKLAVFHTVHIASDCVISHHQMIGSPWYDVTLAENAQLKDNKLTAAPWTQVSIIRSDFSRCHLNLVYFSHFTLQESLFEENKIDRVILSDSSLTESDFIGNILVKSYFSKTVIHASRITRLSFQNTRFRDCEFESCDIQGIEFENCTFEECVFARIVIVANRSYKITGRHISKKTISDCHSFEEFLQALS